MRGLGKKSGVAAGKDKEIESKSKDCGEVREETKEATRLDPALGGRGSLKLEFIIHQHNKA